MFCCQYPLINCLAKNKGLSGWVMTGFKKLDNNGNVTRSSDGSNSLITPWNLNQISNGFPSQPYISFHTNSYSSWNDDSSSDTCDSICERIDSDLLC